MRYLPLTEADRQAMLAAIGASSVEELFKEVPASAVRRRPVDLPDHAGELSVERQLLGLAQKNLVAGEVPFFLGAGAYRHPVPAAVDYLIQRGEFLTAYTPYQPEIAQGTLQYLFEFQTQAAMLTGMEVANASLYDGSTACTEAVLMANRVTRRQKALLSGGLHPHYAQILATYAAQGDFTLEHAAPDPEDLEDLSARLDERTACVVVQNPSVFGHIRDLSPLAEAAHAKGALLIVAVTEAVAFGALIPPGDMGADIVVAEGQSIGGGLNFGGPYIGLFATREKYMRQMPGRLCGQTLDADGKRGWVLTLSAREQHIRREKATSNICTNAGLCALAFTVHLSLLGETGFTRLAALNHAKASQLVEKLRLLPEARVVNRNFFNEITLVLPKAATAVVEELAARRILAGVPAARLWPGRPDLLNHLLIAITESVTEEDMDALVAGLKGTLA